MLKTIPSFIVSSIFTFKLHLVPIALLNTIASNIFNLCPHPSKFRSLTLAKNIWTSDSKLGSYHRSMSPLKASPLKDEKHPILLGAKQLIQSKYKKITEYTFGHRFFY